MKSKLTLKKSSSIIDEPIEDEEYLDDADHFEDDHFKDDYFIDDDYDDLPEYIDPNTLIDPRIPEGTLNSEYCKDKYKNNLPIDLDKVVYSEPVTFKNALINLGSDGKGNPRITINHIPGLLEYDGIQLSVIQYISKGSFGVVLKYSEETPLPDEWDKIIKNKETFYWNKKTNEIVSDRPRLPGQQYYELAVKTYTHQTDSEIKLINDLNDPNSFPESSVGMCNTVNSKILKNNSGENFAIMDLMDGTLEDLIKDGLTVEQAIEITTLIATSFNCLLPQFAYTDLKSQNVLYKCYEDVDGNGRVKIVLGDLGSICKTNVIREPVWTDIFYMASTIESTGTATYPPAESIKNAANVLCDEGTMVWDIGVIFLELIGHDVYDFYWGSKLIKHSSKYKNPTVVFLTYIRFTILPIVNDKYKLSNIILQNHTLYDLLKGIFIKKKYRISLDELIQSIGSI